MRNLFGRRPSPAFVIAVIALFVALGGGAYAITLGKNAVKTRNIANGAVKAKKIANSAVTTPKLANSAVTPQKAQVAYAKVSATGVKTNDEKVNSISRLAGTFCFDLAFIPEVAVASADANVNTGVDIDTEVPGNSSCPAAQQDASVETTGGVTPRAFFVVFY